MMTMMPMMTGPTTRFKPKAAGGARRSGRHCLSGDAPPTSSTRLAIASPARGHKFKTELCNNYERGHCPWGSRCIYAHGGHELRKTKVMELLRNGDIESVESYRTRPCMTFVSTGSCPFDIRCSHLHDPRVMGANEYWLRHLEMPDHELKDQATDEYVDNLHHHFANAVSHGTPFGDLIPKDRLHRIGDANASEFERQADWNLFYDRICSGTEGSTTAAAGSTAKGRRATSSLSERQRLEIVLLMRGRPEADRHKYDPRDELLNEPCMILQTQTFHIDGESVHQKGTQKCCGKARGSKSIKTIDVHEVAFGSDANPFVRGVALWFDVPPSKISEDSRTSNRASASDQSKKNAAPSEVDEYLRTTADLPFYLVRPIDEDSFNLTTLILRHRLETLKFASRKNTYMHKIHRNVYEKTKLRALFESLCRHWVSSKWDMTANRTIEIDENTLSPDVDTEYRTKPTFASCLVKGRRGNTTSVLWDSFVREVGLKSAKESQIKNARLPVFKVLSEGMRITPARSSSPRIKKQRFVPQEHLEVCPSRTRCWHEVLRIHDDGDQQENEWDKLFDYFSKKESKPGK